MPRSPATRRSDASNPAGASGSVHPPNLTSPHPALIALACLLGRAAAREVFVFKQISEAASAGSGPTQH
jgi:hypothetical protein